MMVRRRSAELDGLVALVTGGATGIGFATAMELSRIGAAVVVAGRNEERGRAATARIIAFGGDAVFVRADVRHEEDVHKVVSYARETFGGLDYLFNNAGIEGPLCPLTECGPAELEELLGTNVRGVFLGMKHAVPGMLDRGGAIVNCAASAGTAVPFPNGALYGASKAAVVSMTAAAAAECAGRNVRLYAVCPWSTDTPMVERLAARRPDARTHFAAMNPSGRLAAPEDVASVVVDLLTGTAPFASGSAVLVDSGGAVRALQLA